MRLRLLTLAGLILACALVAAGAATAAPASAADATASTAGKGKRTHHARKHARRHKHKRKHHRRTARKNATAPAAADGVSTAPSTAPAATGVTSPAAGSSGSGSGSGSSGAAAPTAVASSCPGSASQPSAANLATIRSATLCLVNQQRAASGVGPLADNGALTAAAQGHSDDMVASDFFDHTNLSGLSPFDRMSAAGYAFSRAAENIAYGGGASGTPAQIVSMWMNSPGHRANILDGALAESGIGVNPGTPGGGAGGTYTQDFGTR